MLITSLLGCFIVPIACRYRKFLLVILAVCSPCVCLGAAPDLYLPLLNTKWHDADTVTADVQLPFGIVLTQQVIRESTYDAWEVTRTRKTVAISNEEIRLGIAARDAVRALSLNATGVYVVPLKRRDAYGRLLGRLYVQQGTKMLALKDWATANNVIRPKEPTP